MVLARSAAELPIILVADDDEDDRMMLREALQICDFRHAVHFVSDGQELMDYLQQSGKFSSQLGLPRPRLVLLDLNMPRKDGREALREIKQSTHLRSIPVVVLTTSKAEEDIVKTYDLGVNSFITKPTNFESLVAVAKDLSRYWFQIVNLPK